MKKLLTVSLVAVMAVSAAHAKIASVEYVDPKFESINTTIGTWGAAQQAIGQDVAAAVVALKGSVDDMNGDNGSVKTDIKNAIEALDVDKVTADDGKYFNTYVEADGKISMEQKAFETTIEAGVNNAPTTGAVYTAVDGAKSYTDTKIQELTDNTIGGQETRLSAAESTIAGIIDEKNGILAQAEADATSKAGLAESNAKGYTDDEIKKLDVEKVTAGDGKYFNTYVEADGKIAMEQKEFETTIKADVNNAPTTGAVYAAVATAKSEAISEADTAAKALIQLSKAMTDCADKQCALTLNKGNITWEEVVNQ